MNDTERTAKQQPSVPEMQADLAATDRDIDRLVKITSNLGAFIRDTHGENRSGYRLDLYKYEALLDEARKLRGVIRDAIAAREGRSS